MTAPKPSESKKLSQLRQALVGQIQPHHLILIGQILAHIDFLAQAIADVQMEIELRLAPFESTVQVPQTIPGIKAVASAAILAEIGADMSRFPTAAHLASWAGLCPTNKESAGKHMQGPMNRGNVWLGAIMGEVAWASIKTKASYFYAQFHRVARRRGRNNAAIAVAHSILTAVYHVLRTGQPYTKLGVDYFDRLDASRIERHHVRRLEQLGFSVAQTQSRLTPTREEFQGKTVRVHSTVSNSDSLPRGHPDRRGPTHRYRPMPPRTGQPGTPTMRLAVG